MKKHRPLKELPQLVRVLMLDGCLLVGGGCSWFIFEKEEYPKDFDILVPPSKIQKSLAVATMLACPVSINSFGGIKLEFVPSVDLIPLSLEEFIKISTTFKACSINPFRVIRWENSV